MAPLYAAIKIIEEHEIWPVNSLEFPKKYSRDKAYELWKRKLYGGK